MFKYTVSIDELYNGDAALYLSEINKSPEDMRLGSYRPTKPLEKYHAPVASKLPSVILTCIAFLIFSSLCFSYISMWNTIATTTKNIDSLESQLADISKFNNEEYDRIMGSVNIEEIRDIAMSELHMTYPEEDQVILVDNDTEDYVWQYSDF